MSKAKEKVAQEQVLVAMFRGHDLAKWPCQGAIPRSIVSRH
jgi:hypothetical protein